jgi:DNA-binding winged helix-turn-helix (wHTH) protein
MRCQHVPRALALHEGTLKVRPAMDMPRKSRYRLDDLQIDVGARSVTRAGVELGVTGLTFDLLLALGRRAPDLVPADVLMEAVWPSQVIGPETLAQRVKLLRRQLGDEAEQPRYIASRRGYGYRLLSSMVELAPDVGDGPAGEAFALYQQGRAIVRGSHASRDEALGFLDRSLEIDPTLAPALAHRALLVAGSVPLSGEPRGRLLDAEHDARQALQLDAGLADAHVALGMIAADRHLWQESARHFQAALELEPDSPLVINLHALSLLRPTGRLQQALAAHERCYRIAPADGFTLHELVLTHSLLGDDDEALRFLDLSRKVSGIPDSPWDVYLTLARVAVRRRSDSEATRWAVDALPAQLRAVGAGEVLSALHAALVDDAKTAAALERFSPFSAHLGVDGVDRRTRGHFIWLIARLGAVEAASALLEDWLFGTAGPRASVELSDLWTIELRSFRAHPRTRRILGRIGLSST